MTAIDLSAIRRALAALPSDHDAAGEHRPTVNEIFTPEQHANALNPRTPIVVGARGAGKSFWAGVLEQDDTRAATAIAYPNLGLEKLVVRPGYTGFPGDGIVTSKIIDARVPHGNEGEKATEFWQAVILGAANSAINPNANKESIRELMERFADPEDSTREFSRLDKLLTDSQRTLLVTFDALDTVSRDWKRSSLLIDALLEVVWALRARRSMRAKLFIRPGQLNDEALQFVELPKLRSGSVGLQWNQMDLYGLLYWRLSEVPDEPAQRSFQVLAAQAGAAIPKNDAQKRRRWALINDRDIQANAMERLAGPYMGRSHKKGRTYDWPYKHLADASGQVTPRSFIKLFVEAAKFGQSPPQQVISAEGIRQGLRAASKVRVDQLGIEYRWVGRALLPLAGLSVPCQPDAVYARWSESKTVETIMKTAADPDRGFLPPFPPRSDGNQMELLAGAMTRIGLFSYREDGRIDIPDLFRVAALMLKKGGTPPHRK